MEKKYAKLSNLVGDTFTVNKAHGYEWKSWDATANRMLISERWQEGYSRRYKLETDKGDLEVSSNQLKGLLEAVYSKGESNINSRTFKVTSNGKTGKDILYFFTALREDDPKAQTAFEEFVDKKNELKKDTIIDDIDEDPIDLNSIPF